MIKDLAFLAAFFLMAFFIAMGIESFGRLVKQLIHYNPWKKPRAVHKGIYIAWGGAPVPDLPGYTIRRGAHQAVVAIDAEGREYLIGRDVLYPYRSCPPQGLPASTLKPGERFIDREAAIPIPLQRK